MVAGIGHHVPSLPTRVQLVKGFEQRGLEYHANAQKHATCLPLPEQSEQKYSGRQDHTRPLLFHAQLCILAHREYMPGLANLSLYRIHQTLMNLKMYETTVTAVCRLVHYAFVNTLPGNPLRDLLLHFCVCIKDELKYIGALDDLQVAVPGFEVAMQDASHALMKRAGEDGGRRDS